MKKNVMRNIGAWLLVIGIGLYFLIATGSCNDDILPPQKPVVIQLSTDDVGVTEAWIKVTTNDAKGTFALTRDSITVAANLHSPIDTIIHDEGLLPNHTYNYFAETDTPLTITTMDTTSHNFTWQIDTLGDGDASALYDVAIINDTLAYAVGEIYKKDSTGQFETTPYNAAKWNGTKWELMRIKFRLDYGTSIVYTYTTISAIFAFTPNDIWFCHYVGGVTRYKDGNWVMMEFPLFDGPGGANKIWGVSSSNLYFVGSNGRITHYNGSTWQKLQSGTTLNIYDIWGAYNSKKAGHEILAVATNLTTTRERKILSINGTSVTTISDNPITRELTGLWFIPNRHYYVVGEGIFEKHILSDTSWKDNGFDISNYYTTKITGNDINDVFIVGSFGECLHFNGVSWKSFREGYTAINGSYGDTKTRGKLVITVGYVNNKACALIGKRE